MAGFLARQIWSYGLLVRNNHALKKKIGQVHKKNSIAIALIDSY